MPTPRALPFGRAVAALGAVLVVALALIVGSATAASAHAVVISSQPGDRERLPSAPTEASVTFSEPVEVDLGGLTVLDREGNRADDGNTTQPKGDILKTALKPDLPNGTYVMNYRVVSADGHPISGAVIFSIGAELDEAGAGAIAATTSPGWEVVGAVGRFLAYVGGLAAAGLVFFQWFLHDGAPDRKRLVGPTTIAAVVGLVGQLIVIAAQAVLASGQGVGAIVDPNVLSTTLTGELGWASSALVAGLVAIIVATRLTNEVGAQAVAFYGALSAAGSFALWGHDTQSEPRWLAISADVLHAASAALWFGGLLGLILVLRARYLTARDAVVPAPSGGEGGPSAAPAGDASTASRSRPASGGGVALLERPPTVVGGVSGDASSTAGVDGDGHDGDGGEGGDGDGDGLTPGAEDSAGILIRFSTLATVVIVLLGIAGVALAWIELGSIGALFDSTYGRTLLVKLVIVAGIAVAAAYNHVFLLPLVLGERDEVEVDDDGTIIGDEPTVAPEVELGRWRRLLKTVRFEAIAIVAVLAVTAVLVNVTPGKTASGDLNAGPFNETKAVSTKGQVNLTVSPAKAGNNAIHITYLTADGKPADIAIASTLEMTLPDKGVGPLTRPATKAGPGHYVVLSTPDLSIAGTWTVVVVSRLSEFEQERTSFSVPIT